MIARPRLNLFETIRVFEHDIDFEPHSECQPTKAAPGSLEKIRVMCERIKRGEHLHHEDDQRVLACIEKQQEMAEIIKQAAKDARDVTRAKREELSAQRLSKRVRFPLACLVGVW